MKRKLLAATAALALGAGAGCRPCGCKESRMDAVTKAVASEATGHPVAAATLKFDWTPNPFSDDEFSLSVTYQNPAPPPAALTETVTGTYHKSGDEVTFTATGGTSRIIQNGIKYTIKCEGKTLILKRAGSPDLKFSCG